VPPVAVGQSAVGVGCSGTADGTATGPRLACTADGLTVGEANNSPELAGDGRHGRPVSAPDGPAEAPPARDGEPDGRTACAPPTVAVVPSWWPDPLVPPGPPAPAVPGGTALFPPVSMLELTSTRAARNGGTIMATAVMEAAAARPAASRIHTGPRCRAAGTRNPQRRHVETRLPSALFQSTLFQSTGP